MSNPDTTLADRLGPVADTAVEVGVGTRPGVARALADRGIDVTATDVVARPVPDGVRFVRDDVTDPELAHYRGAGLVYARNLPPELHRPTRAVARAVGARCLFTTLGGDPATVPVEAEQLGDGATLYRTTDRG